MCAGPEERGGRGDGTLLSCYSLVWEGEDQRSLPPACCLLLRLVAPLGRSRLVLEKAGAEGIEPPMDTLASLGGQTAF